MNLLFRSLIVIFFSFQLCAAVERSDYLADISDEMLKVWPKNRTINIVCHGHSVPSGYFRSPRVETFDAYPHLLHRGLKAIFPSAVINVIVSGIGGESSDQGVERFETEVLTHRPDVITIDYSLNDRRIGLESAKTAWSIVIEKAKAKGVKVILLTPTIDTNADLSDPEDPLNQHAEQVRALAEEYDVALVDSLAAFKRVIADGVQADTLMSQSNHPNRLGHELVAAELLKWFPVESTD